MSGYTLTLISDFTNIYGCKIFFDEFKNLFKKDKTTGAQYQKWLWRQFSFLTKNTIEQIIQLKNFELLSSTSSEWPIYSIRRPESTGNPRVLFSVVSDETGHSYIMLLAFKELHDDYKRFIPIAVDRMKHIVQEMEEDKGENGH